MQPQSPKPIKTIRPESSSVGEYLGEVWRYRSLIWVFALLDLKTQYAQTRFNLMWVILRPLMVLLLFTFVFDKLMHIPGLAYPYALFAFSGLILWNNFSSLVNNAGSVVVANQAMVKKTYFPRLILIISKTLISLIEVSISLLLLFALMLFYRQAPYAHIVFFPLFILAALIPGVAVTLWLNALTVRYRDLNHFVPTLVGFLIWLTPVFYPVTLIPEGYHYIMYLNPLAGTIQGFRWSVLGDTFPDLLFLPSLLLMVAALIAGVMMFIRSERELADYI